MDETTISIVTDEETNRKAEAALAEFDTTPSQLFSLLIQAIAYDTHLSLHLVKIAQTPELRPINPNAQTREAIEAARLGHLKSFNSVQELLADLHSDVDD